MDLSEVFEHQLTSSSGGHLFQKYQLVAWVDPWCSSLCYRLALGLYQMILDSYGAESFVSYHDLIENFNCFHSIHIKSYCFTSQTPKNTKDSKIHLAVLYFFIEILFKPIFSSPIKSIAIYQLLPITSIISTALQVIVAFVIAYFFPGQI